MLYNIIGCFITYKCCKTEKTYYICIAKAKKAMSEEKENKEGVSLDDFVSPHKVRAFTSAYAPADLESLADEVYTDTRLRRYFQAFPRNIGDPLIVYLDLLEKEGFVLRNSITGEPALFVKNKQRGEASMLESTFGNVSTS